MYLIVIFGVWILLGLIFSNRYEVDLDNINIDYYSKSIGRVVLFGPFVILHAKYVNKRNKI